MTAPGTIRFDDVPPPVAGPEEVLARVRRIGVCGSDIHVFHGKHPYTSYPVVQGHEFSAEIVEAPDGLPAGTLVTMPPQITCGSCESCRGGRYHICETLKVMGFQAPGVAQEYVALPRREVIALPAGFTPEMGALVEPVAVAMHAAGRAGSVAGARVLVLGAGPIGNLVAQAARSRGASTVVVTDVSEHRLEIARQCGLARAVDARRGDADEQVRAALGGGADVTFECAGAEAAAGQAIRLARKGSVIVIVGVFGDPPRVDLGLVQDRELSLVGTLMYQRGDYRDAIQALASGAIVHAPLVSVSFPFRRYLDAYRHIDGNKDRVMKVMIDLDRVTG